MELKQLEYFLAISKLKSFTLAADKLYISQPGITAAIRRLEDELGVELFVKKRKTAVLTPEGTVFAKHIEHVINDVNTALTQLEDLKNLNEGMLRVGISPVSGISTPAFLLAKFRTLYPDLHIELMEETSEKLQHLLKDEKIDIAFLVQDEATEGLETFALSSQEFVAGIPTFHLLSKRQSLTAEMLKNEHFVLLKEGCPVRTAIDEFFSSSGYEISIAFETNYVQTIERLVLCGAGITILPAEVFEGSSNLIGIPLSPSLQLTIYAAYRRNHAMSKAMQTFLEFLRSACVL